VKKQSGPAKLVGKKRSKKDSSSDDSPSIVLLDNPID